MKYLLLALLLASCQEKEPVQVRLAKLMEKMEREIELSDERISYGNELLDKLSVESLLKMSDEQDKINDAKWQDYTNRRDARDSRLLIKDREWREYLGNRK